MGCLYVIGICLLIILCVLIILPIANLVWILSALLLIVWLPFYSVGYSIWIGMLLSYAYFKQGLKKVKIKNGKYSRKNC